MRVHAEQVRDFAAELRGRIAGELRLDTMTRGLYATDASIYEVMPLGVVIPRHTDDVHAAVEAASRVRIPILARGGGSSLAGQAVNEAVVIDFSRHLDAVVEFDPEAGRARVEPGITHERFNARFERAGWMSGPDPASGSRATLGGMLANNATGTHSILYGNTIRHVDRVNAVLADGTRVSWGADSLETWRRRSRSGGTEGRIVEGLDELIRRRGDAIRADMPAHWRRNNGYRLEELLGEGPNLARLLCGSEGTLAVVTDLTMSLVRIPARTCVGVVHFASRRDALQSVTAILETEPSAVELLDGAAIRQCRASRGFCDRMTFVQGMPGAVLLVEFYVESAAHGAARLDTLAARLAGGVDHTGIVRLEEPPEISNAWGVRKEALGLIMSVRGDRKPLPFIEDASVPVEHLAEYIAELEEVLARVGTEAIMYAHASAGCLHVRPFIDTRVQADVERMRDIASASAGLVKRHGGWVSSEHGDGLARSWLNPEFLGPSIYEACREVKRIFDPDGLLNPGRVVDAPPMTSHLRAGPDSRPLSVMTDLDFSAEGGLGRAVDLCNGNGACRRVGAGTMCPSFMATREERDSTRGRANILRLAMAGRLPGAGLTDEAVREALDLCVQCKACKTECPSAVDMAKIKTEWLSQWWRTHRMPLRTRLFANLPRLAASVPDSLAGLVARAARTAPARWLMHRTLGIDRRRPLPAFARRPFSTAPPRPVPGDADRAVVLFVDTFSNRQHPEVPAAACRVLAAAGYRVLPVATVCCGRTWLSKGDVTTAQLRALETVEALHPYAEAGLDIVGLEPSCVLTLADEFLSLLPGDPRTQAVADRAMTFEQFVARERGFGRFDGVRWKTGPRHVLVHGHCHQKALTGTGPSVACLETPPGWTASVIDAACCGMAGSFGYEVEHYDVSVAMAEDRLAPAVRCADPGDLLAAAGTSCRAQIGDLTGRRARHPAELLAAALAP